MLTVNDIREITFNKSVSGYKTTEVDIFIDQCADTVAALIKSNAELEKKLEVLADKLVEYRNEEDSIRTALLSAQRLGDTVVREANHKAGLILEDAKIKADKMQENAKRSIRDEEKELERIRKEVSNFKAHLLSIYRDHLAMIDILPEEDKDNVKESVNDKESEEQVSTEETTTETPSFEENEKSTEKAEEPIIHQHIDTAEQSKVMNIPAIQEENTPNLDVISSESNNIESINKVSVPVSRFTDLKFGEDYDISKDEEDTSAFFKHRK